jgi:molybdate transport system substrate-binding protein
MKTGRVLSGVVRLILCAWLSLWSWSVMAGEVLVAVAANFTGVARELVPLFEAQTGHRIRMSYGSTGRLYAQIEQGAPYDVFLAADATRPALAEARGLAVPESRITYAVGRLVLWSLDVTRFSDGEAYLRALQYRRLAVANPKTAPYGRAAQEAMEQLGVWTQVQPHLVRGDSIAQTFQFTATESVDAGFVALAQINGWSGARGAVWLVPDTLHAPITQDAVLLKRGEHNEAARAFMAFLASDAVRQLIGAHGYDLVAGGETSGGH